MRYCRGYGAIAPLLVAGTAVCLALSPSGAAANDPIPVTPSTAAPPAPIPPPPVIPAPPPPPLYIKPVAPPTVPIPTAAEEDALVKARSATPKDDYVLCDGYPAPSAVADGMTRWTASLILMSWGAKGTQRSNVDFIEPSGIANCGAALADLARFPQYWLRKVSLLRARALHRLKIADMPGALRDLDAADAAVVDRNDAHYHRSLGLGLALTRAYALRRNGEADKARTLAFQAVADRPYSREVALAASVALGDDVDTTFILRQWAKVDPAGDNALFDAAFEHGRFADAIAAYPGVGPIPKLGNEPMQLREQAWLDQQNRADADVFWIKATSRYAYALASLGRVAEARAAIAAARERLAKDLPAAPPPTPPDNASNQDKIRATVAAQGDLLVKTQAVPFMDNWAKLVEMRCALTPGNAEQTWTTLASPTGKFPRDYATYDLAAAVAALIPARAAIAAGLTRALKGPRHTAPEVEIPLLFKSLPQTEVASDTGDFKSPPVRLYAAKTMFRVDEKAPGVTTIAFTGLNDSFALVEERALLEAADRARQTGLKGVVVLARRNIRHVTINTMYGREISRGVTSFETQVDVALVDPAAPPAALKDAPWRILNVDTLEADLGPIYRPEGVKQ